MLMQRNMTTNNKETVTFDFQDFRETMEMVNEAVKQIPYNLITQLQKEVEGMKLMARSVNDFMKPCKYNEALNDVHALLDKYKQ